jgi:methyl-accepting chemotaxis protein
MKIKDKLLGLAAISVSSLLLVVGLSWTANSNLMGINHAATDVKQLEVTLLNLRRNVTSIRDITCQNSQISHENAQAAGSVAEQAKNLERAIAQYTV